MSSIDSTPVCSTFQEHTWKKDICLHCKHHRSQHAPPSHAAADLSSRIKHIVDEQKANAPPPSDDDEKEIVGVFHSVTSRSYVERIRRKESIDQQSTPQQPETSPDQQDRNHATQAFENELQHDHQNENDPDEDDTDREDDDPSRQERYAGFQTIIDGYEPSKRVGAVNFLIGQLIQQAFASGELNAIMRGLKDIIKMIKIFQLTPADQSTCLTKLAINVIENMKQNVLRNTTHLLALGNYAMILTFISKCVCAGTEAPLTVDNLFPPYQPTLTGAADATKLIISYIETIALIIKLVSIQFMHQPCEPLHDILKGIMCMLAAPTAAILGRSVEARKLLWKHHADDTITKETEGFYDMMDDFRILLGHLRFRVHHFLFHSISCLDDEMITIIHMKPRWGCRIRIRGVTVNDQLFTMLTDTVYRHYYEITGSHEVPFEQPSAQIMSVMNGTGPQQLSRDIRYQYQFQSWNWYAVEQTSNGEFVCNLMDLCNRRLWGAGIPWDIAPCPTLSNSRVIILDKPIMTHASNVVRDFQYFPAQVAFIEPIPLEQVTEMLQNMAQMDVETRQQYIEKNQERTNETKMESPFQTLLTRVAGPQGAEDGEGEEAA